MLKWTISEWFTDEPSRRPNLIITFCLHEWLAWELVPFSRSWRIILISLRLAECRSRRCRGRIVQLGLKYKALVELLSSSRALWRGRRHGALATEELPSGMPWPNWRESVLAEAGSTTRLDIYEGERDRYIQISSGSNPHRVWERSVQKGMRTFENYPK